MRLEVDQTSSSNAPLNGNLNQPTDQEKFTEYLNAGIRAAQAGDRRSARRNLMSALDIDTRSENAWLWLASISEYPEELLVFLNNVLDLNPTNERALQWSASTKLLLSKTLVQRGVDAHENSRHNFAVQCFEQALTYDMHNVKAWLWLAALAESDERRMENYRRVLEIDPENETANEAVCAAEANSRNALFARAAKSAVNGDREGALDLLNKVFNKWPDDKDAWVLRSHVADSHSERESIWKHILEIEPDNAYAAACVESWKLIEAAAECTPEQHVRLGHAPVIETGAGDEKGSIAMPPQPSHAEEYSTIDAINISEEFVETASDPFSTRVEPVSTEQETVVCGGRVTILVAEGNSTARRLMVKKLEDTGYEVICAESGREAIEMARRSSPSLALVDIALTGLDGYATCRMLRDDPQFEKLPIVLISGKDGWYEENRGQACGASGFITKPFGPETLMKTVEGFLPTAE
jgi:twitching motility two-component system response regulator PilG